MKTSSVKLVQSGQFCWKFQIGNSNMKHFWEPWPAITVTSQLTMDILLLLYTYIVLRYLKRGLERSTAFGYIHIRTSFSTLYPLSNVSRMLCRRSIHKEPLLCSVRIQLLCNFPSAKCSSRGRGVKSAQANWAFLLGWILLYNSARKEGLKTQDHFQTNLQSAVWAIY